MTALPTEASERSSDTSNDSFEIIDVSDALCSVSRENYLSLPEEVSALSSVNDLESVIENFKEKILSMPDNSEEKILMVRRLTELRLRLENLKEHNVETASEKNQNECCKVLLGHHFTLSNFPVSALHYCDRCSGIIWNVLHNWYLCSDCDYKCHEKCLSYVCRVCAHFVVSENPKYILDICPEPEDGLANQNYRCAECLAHITFASNKIIDLGAMANTGNLLGNNTSESRLCDYTGKYYCSTCHWNSTSVIPARVIFNWDFKERFVCLSSKKILKLMSKLPILKLEELNSVLFVCIEELGTVKVLRQQLMQIKKYLTSCKTAVEKQLLWRYRDKIHFLENEDNYCIQDLVDLRSGELITFLNEMKDDFIRHIQVECELCKERGFFCEFCKDNKLIYPFEENVITCSECHSTFHFFCWIKNNQKCPKCDRIQQRLLKIQIDVNFNAMDS